MRSSVVGIAGAHIGLETVMHAQAEPCRIACSGLASGNARHQTRHETVAGAGGLEGLGLVYAGLEFLAVRKVIAPFSPIL